MKRRAYQRDEEDISEDEMLEDDSDVPLSGDFDEDEDDFEDELGTSEGGEDGAPAQPGSGKGKRKQRPEGRAPIYDVDALHEKLEDIGWADEVAWEETLAITHEDPKQVENVDDDISRELSFYNQALSTAQEAMRLFDSAGIPWRRPTDYYAEMVKSDEHMAKVKEELMVEQRQLEQAEERRKAREAKQYSKQVQVEKEKERNAQKKRQIEEISKLRKQREKSGFAGEMDYDAEIDALDRPKQQRQPGKYQDRGPAGQQRGGPNKKRLAKNAKYGFGGRKGAQKQNDAYSAADMDGYKPGKFRENFNARKGGVQKKFGAGKKAGPPGAKGAKGGPKKNNAKARPGKSKREAMKQKHGVTKRK